MCDKHAAAGMVQGLFRRSLFLERKIFFWYLYYRENISFEIVSCNCKNRVKPKYADGGELAVMPDAKSGIGKIFRFLFQIVFGVFCFAVIIIAVIPFMLYLLVCLMLGKEARMTLFNPLKWKRNKGTHGKKAEAGEMKTKG